MRHLHVCLLCYCFLCCQGLSALQWYALKSEQGSHVLWDLVVLKAFKTTITSFAESLVGMFAEERLTSTLNCNKFFITKLWFRFPFTWSCVSHPHLTLFAWRWKAISWFLPSLVYPRKFLLQVRDAGIFHSSQLHRGWLLFWLLVAQFWEWLIVTWVKDTMGNFWDLSLGFSWCWDTFSTHYVRLLWGRLVSSIWLFTLGLNHDPATCLGFRQLQSKQRHVVHAFVFLAVALLSWGLRSWEYKEYDLTECVFFFLLDLQNEQHLKQ